MSFLLYGNTISGDFVYDDQYLDHLREFNQIWQVWRQPFLADDLTAGLFRPLTSFSFALNFALFGSSPISFHIINIILNGIVTFLVFLLSQKLFSHWVLSLFIALFYAFLPIHSEAVANIKSREEILAACFGILSWLVLISATEGKRINYLKVCLSSLLFILAVLSKELIIALPVLFVLILIFRKKFNWLNLGKIIAIFIFITSLYMIWRFLILGEYAFGRDKNFFVINPLSLTDFVTRIWTSFKIAFIYISKTFIPWNLSAAYHYKELTPINNIFESWQAMGGLIFLIVLFGLAVMKRLRNSPIGVGALTFLVSYLVISKIIFKEGDILAERWMYFPSIGLSFIGGFLLYFFFIKFIKIKWLGIAALVTILLIYSGVLINRNLVWLSEESLFKSMVKDAPLSVHGHQLLAQWYLERNLLNEAKKETEVAFNIYQDHPPLLNTMGNIALEEGDFKLAEEMFLKAIKIAPEVTTAYQNAANLYYKTGQYEKAEKVLEYLVTHWTKPRIGDYMDYALVLAKLGKYQTSLEVINRKLMPPTNPRVKLLLAINYYKLGNIEEAKKYFDWDSSLSEEEKLKILQEF
ncbi:tetratricopeptide repeat protein [Candidatus Daviesbacteria bacterium]|nr:tetratricopeptide repeat protein [Candidatus Daviesbacteria bacterium]